MKLFFWKDLSGRNYSGTYNQKELLAWENDEDDRDGTKLHRWVRECKQGDEWGNNANSIICISENARDNFDRRKQRLLRQK